MGTTLIVQVSGWTCAPLRPLLQADGYDVHVLEDLGSVLEALHGDPPLLLIVGGAADLNLYRTLRRASAVPILALVPEIDRDKVLAAFDAGVDDYQAGPISNRVIIAHIRATLRSVRRSLPSVESSL